MKNLLNIYNTFKTVNYEKEKESLNDIVKGTKSVLANKMKFNQYLNNYFKTTERYTFKSPGITDYPVFKKKSNILIPVKRKKINFFEDLNKANNENNDDDSPLKTKKLLIISPNNSVYKSRLINNINTLKVSKKILRNKLYKLCSSKNLEQKDRYNPLFLDFFHKWNSQKLDSLYNENSKLNTFSSRDFIDDHKYQNNNIEYIKNDNYSELKYDDNEIFNTDYTKFINEKIEYIKNNIIENTQVKLESSFNDANGKEIKLKLESIKICFKSIKNKKNLFKSYNVIPNRENDIYENDTKIIYMPLYYAFLIFHKNFQLFKHLLISSISFSNNFETISLNDSLIGHSLKEFTTKNENENQNIKPCDSNKNVKSNIFSPKRNIGFRKLATKNYTSALSGNSPKVENKQNGMVSFTMLKNSFLEKVNNNNQKKEEIIHSNCIRNRNISSNIHYLFDNNNEQNKQTKNDKNNQGNKSNNYNEYIFIWETYTKTFLVTVEVPMIYFKYKNLKKEIIAYCDKNLFLYIYKNNFINWDFYVLNFLFSIKSFRKIILNNYAFNKNYIFPDFTSKTISNNKSDNNKLNNILSFRNKSKNKNVDNERYSNQNNKFEFFKEAIIINENDNKIYNLLNENNETYLFFYTNELYQNSIIKLYSYIIIIDYDKLNPKLKWKYYLDFKQMKQLNEITKYENLDTFLPKIIKTDFQNGFLSMDFTLFNEFNIEILGYEKKNLMDESKIKNKKTMSGGTTSLNNNTQNTKELSIDIQFPYIMVKRAINQENNLSFNSNKIDLNINFLQNINNYKIDSWSKKILEILNNENDSLNGNISISTENIVKRSIPKKSPFAGKFSTKNLFKKSISFNSIPVTSKFYYHEDK